MKKCNHCNHSCYDTELYCGNCGKALAPTLKCTYCGMAITDLDAEHCTNCGGLLAFDKYPVNKGTIFCTKCGKKHPVNSKYCTACGSLVNNRNTNNTINNSATNNTLTSKKAFLISVLTVVTITIILPAIVTFIAFFASMADDEYNSDRYESGEIVIEIPENVEYRKINIEDLHIEIKTINEGDYVEITGYKDYSSSYSTDLVPLNFTRENKDNIVHIDWNYALEDKGQYIDDYYIKGQEIVIRGRVETVYDSIATMYIDGYEVVKEGETDG